MMYPFLALGISQWQYVKGQRGRAQLLVDGYTFIRTKRYNQMTYWLCSKAKSQGCLARLGVDRDKRSMAITNPRHNHTAAPLKDNQILFTNSIEDIVDA